MGKKRNQQGFTMLELLIVIALLTLFTFLTVPFGMEFYREQVLEEESVILTNNLKIAQSRAQSGKGDSWWGIKFMHEENKYVLFKGESYNELGRNMDQDKEFTLSSGLTSEGIVEVVFEKGTGYPHITEN